MTKKQQQEALSFLHASEFTTTLLADFTHQPPNKVDLKFTSAREKLANCVTDLGGKAATQAGGAFGEETEKQGMLRSDLEEEISDINATASSIAEETENPAMMERFRIPHGVSDPKLAASARAMAAAIRELSLNGEFEAHGHPADTATDLEEMAGEFEGSEGEQGTVLSTRTGTTASIPATLHRVAGFQGLPLLNPHEPLDERP